MGMKLKSGADLCGFQLTNFCIQGEASAPSDAALGRKYVHTNATDDVATGISLLHRERIYLGEGAWRATAYLDDIAAIQTKLDMILGDVDLDGVIENMNEVIKFLEDNKDTENLMALLNNKLDKSGGTLSALGNPLTIKRTDGDGPAIAFSGTNGSIGAIGVDYNNEPYFYRSSNKTSYTLIHSGNIGSQKVAGLATPVTIWGQSFDGTEDVSGNIRGRKAEFTIYGYNSTLASDVNILTHNNNKSLWLGYGMNAEGNATIIAGTTIEFRYGASRNFAAFINSSGNVTIGGSDLASTNYKFFVHGSLLATTARTQELRLGESVNGSATADNKWYYASIGYEYEQESPHTLDPAIVFKTMYNTYAEGTGVERMRITAGGNVIIGDRSELKSGAKLQVKGDLYVDGNIIATKEVSAGGAAAEEEDTSGSGSAEGVSEVFTPTSTSMAFDHNLGENVIVQVYEKSGNVWNMVIVDTEITSATRVTLRFGKTETTQHKVVIMGV